MNKIFNKKDFFVLIVGITAIIIGFIYIQFGARVNNGHPIGKQQQPIIFVSDQNRTSSAAQHLVTTTSRSGGSVAMHIDVYDNDKIKYLANKNMKRAKQPIIEVSYSSRNSSTKSQAASLQKILAYLNRNYDYQSYDAIGFGSGALTVYDNALTYGTKKNKMRLIHFISIAGPYQGIMVNRHPNASSETNRSGQSQATTNGSSQTNDHQRPVPQALSYQEMINRRFPSYSDLKKKSANLDNETKVLNIYGVLGPHDKSDGRVSEKSASSLKYLVKKDNYQSLRLTGPYALHSNILDNQVAERLVNRFLFND